MNISGATPPMSTLLRIIAHRLAPLFQGEGTWQDAQAAAIQAIEAYNPQSAADCFRIARLIALSMAAFAAAAQAAEASDLSPAQHLRYFNVANNLSRSAARTEAMLNASPQPSRQRPSADAVIAQEDAAMALVDQAISSVRTSDAGQRQFMPDAALPAGMRHALLAKGAALRAATSISR